MFEFIHRPANYSTLCVANSYEKQQYCFLLKFVLCTYKPNKVQNTHMKIISQVNNPCTNHIQQIGT